MEKLKYTYSRLSAQSICHLVTLHYDIANCIDCKFYVLGLHDNYLVKSGGERYILRIYRNDWRSKQEIKFELDLLDFLGTKDVRAATPLTTKTGDLSFDFICPEGKRVAALFPYADGYAPGNSITIEHSSLLGSAVANVHKITDTYNSTLPPKDLDIPYLLDESINVIQPFIDRETRNYLNSLQKILKGTLPPPRQMPGVYGICIGDVNSTNFHINNKNEITLFDFDQCGYADRSFEIGKFVSSIPTDKPKLAISNAFIEGYQEVRPLTNDELAAIPYYELLSVIWVMAIHVYNADRTGYKYLEKPFWERQIAKLKQLEKLLPNRHV